MKEYIKLFEGLSSADGYVIEDIPFTSTVKPVGGGGNDINLTCNESNKKLVVKSDTVEVVDDSTILYLKNGSTVVLTGDTITSSMTSQYKSTLVSVEFSSKVTSIGSSAFSGCTSLSSITIPDSVTSIGDKAFSGCTSLPVDGYIRYADTYLAEAVDKTQSTYTIKSDTKWIGTYAFSGCTSLSSLTIGSSVTSIGSSAFYNCSGLTSATIPSSVTSIDIGAFYSCTSLTGITIPSSVSSIGNYAFRECTGLTEMTCEATTPPTLSSGTFTNVLTNIPVYVPSGSISTYQNAQYWSTFTNFQAIE